MKGASHDCFKYKLRLWGGRSEAREGVLAPVEDEQQTEKHAAKMREVGYAVGKKETFEQLDSSIANDEPFGFDGHEEIEVDALFGEKHSEGQQDAVDGSRSAHGKAPAGNEQVAKSCANAADEVVDQEAARAPIVFQYIAEHPKGEHIKNYVAPVGVHEHVGKELPDAETAGGHGVEGQHGGDIVEVIKCLLSCESVQKLVPAIVEAIKTGDYMALVAAVIAALPDLEADVAKCLGQ